MPLPDDWFELSQELHELMGDGPFICDGCGRHEPLPPLCAGADMRRDFPWGLWLIAATASFLAIEIPALRTPRQERTFSAFLRRLLGVTPQRKGHRLLEVGFVAVLAWLIAHILHEHIEAAG